MMTKQVVFSACVLLLVVNVVECRPHPEHGHRNKKDRMLFVFGDSFVDAGNRPPSQTGPQWSYPYGISDSAHHKNPTGRFSDGLVQSDFLARILGRGDESPPPSRLREANKVDPAGVNFAMAGSGALVASPGEDSSSLATQVAQFRRLVKHDIVDDKDLDDSVALIAFSGLRDYRSVTVTTSNDQMKALVGQVTDAIVESVKELQDSQGVSKVVVNSLPPIGCQPFRASMYNYAHCDGLGNTLSDMHNAALRRKLDALQDDDYDVMLLDIHAAFADVVRNRYSPCCAETSGTGDGFCGQVDGNGNALYTLCTDPANYFYWDYVHPTQAAWEAVMDNLQPDIQDFLGI
ncbi:unnamed protein product [Urochloa decumbens]|uniref:GDSL esterase/lipase n=1 Tax=Urochloa decumbens TaxID=240449 RepID=A0ABC8W926_9POAL